MNSYGQNVIKLNTKTWHDIQKMIVLMVTIYVPRMYVFLRFETAVYLIVNKNRYLTLNF